MNILSCQQLVDGTPCGAIASVEHEYVLRGAGFGPRGTETLVVMQRQRCVLGHCVDVEVDSILLPPGGA